MDNKDFEEVEDIFGAELDENYDVPVFDEQANTDNDEVAVKEEAPVYDVKPEVVEEPVNEASTYDIKPEVEETVTPEPVVDAPTYGPVPVEPVEYTTDEVQPVSVETNYEALNEHPDAVVSLNNNSNEEEKEEVKLEDVPPVKLGDNKSLKFVLIIGIIILVAIFFLPYISEYLNIGI